MDGFNLVEKIKEQAGPSASTIMMLTSGGQRGDAARCGALGVAAYLLKPIRQAELRDAIVRVLTPKDQAGAAPMITRHNVNDASVPAKSLDILLAEDNPVNQKLAIRLLEKRGHRVIVVGNGKEALTALEKRSFDLVLMDVQMPEMDGLQATALLREREKLSGHHQVVVAMTALVMKGDRERCIAAGMDGYLSKPIRPQELDDVLDSYMTQGPGHAPTEEVADPYPGSVATAELLERIDGDRGFLSELLELFRNDYPAQLRAAREAVESGDPVVVQRIAHSLKGALKNLAATVASDLACELEDMGKSGEIASALDKLTALDAEVARVVAALDALCQETVA
jgi:CheY-like chemotaxis protein